MTVMADALYVARLSPEASRWPYWLLRRCVVPYVAARQFLVLRRDGLPTAFAGWVLESDAGDRPWRCDHYLPARIEIAQPGRPCVTQVISPYLSPGAVVTAVARTLGLTAPPPWIERGADGRVVRIHNNELPERTSP